MRANHWLVVAAGLLLGGVAQAGNEGDPHYTAAGFFDTHVCNWPDKPRFLMALFSTTRFDEVAKVAVFAPDGRQVGDLDMSRFRAFKTKAGQAKRAFITHFDLPAQAADGWYRAQIVLKDGSRVEARDYVLHQHMAHATGIHPAPDAKDVAATTELRWDPIPGAKYYKVYLRDVWAGPDVTESPLLAEPRFLPPAGLLQPGGEYVWRIHARDIDGDTQLGDFNYGSLGPEMGLTVK